MCAIAFKKRIYLPLSLIPSHRQDWTPANVQTSPTCLLAYHKPRQII